jgi:2-haloacid dehalogenase
MSQEVKALLFDVFGTVVDWRYGVVRDVIDIARTTNTDVDAAAFAEAWRADYLPAMDLVRRGELPWTKLDALHRRTLDRLLDEFGLTGLDEREKEWLNMCWHRLDPWPDVPPGLCRLKQRFVVAAFSNGNVSLLVDIAKRAGIPWDCIFSAEMFMHYKPDAETYQGAVGLLGLSPHQVMLVAAHEDDLCSAADQGLATAFVLRSGETRPNRDSNVKPIRDYTYTAGDFQDLATALAT